MTHAERDRPLDAIAFEELLRALGRSLAGFGVEERAAVLQLFQLRSWRLLDFKLATVAVIAKSAGEVELIGAVFDEAMRRFVVRVSAARPAQLSAYIEKRFFQEQSAEVVDAPPPQSRRSAALATRHENEAEKEEHAARPVVHRVDVALLIIGAVLSVLAVLGIRSCAT